MAALLICTLLPTDAFAETSSGVCGADVSNLTWAVEKGVTTGYNDDTFRPNAICPRWAVVLFMYRDMK